MTYLNYLDKKLTYLSLEAAVGIVLLTAVIIYLLPTILTLMIVTFIGFCLFVLATYPMYLAWKYFKINE